MKKLSLLLMSIVGLLSSSITLQAQQLFSVSQNNLSKEAVTLLQTQIVNTDVTPLSLVRNNENKDVYSVPFSSAQNTQIIILNEETGNNVLITRASEAQLNASLQSTEFQLSPFFIEELKQGIIGDVNRYLLVETTSGFIVNNVASVAVSGEAAYIPRYFYGKKENVKEALPKDRKIIGIYKEKPQLILAFPDDPELQRYASQWEEERSYYVYMYQLPDGSLTIYDEHFNPDNSHPVTRAGEQLQFQLTSINMDEARITATEYAFGIWGEALAGTVPVDISVESKNLGNPYVIGQSYRMPNFLNSGQVPGVPVNTWYHSPLWNQLIGYDVTSQRDIRLEMNSTFNFYLGITGNPSYGQMDWVTVMLHEVCHGLGFYPLCGQNGAYSYGAYPGILDRQLFSGPTGPCMAELSQSERASLVVSSNLYCGAPGSNLLAANNSTRVKMYAPYTWEGGSSTSHWDNSVSFTTFMKPSINYGWKLHTIGSRKIGILMDLGWQQPGESPEALYVNFDANGGAGTMGVQIFLPNVAQNLRVNDFTKTGSTFTGWNTKADGTGKSYANQQSIIISEDMTLFAQWEVSTYTLTFNPTVGGTVSPTSKTVIYGEPVGELPIPVKEGYAFKDWRWGAIIITEDTIWNYTENRTVTAAWAQLPKYIISATASEGGTISPSGNNTVSEGSSLLFTITPDEDYILLHVLVDGDSIGTEPEYLFENIVASHSIHAEFKSTIGISDNNQNTTIQIVPNPTTGELRIDNGQLTIDNVEIFDIYGSKLSSHHLIFSSSNHLINISHLQAGIYFVKITTGEGTVVQKVVKL